MIALLKKNNLHFLTGKRIQQHLLLYTIENKIKKKKWKLLPNIIPNHNPVDVNNPSGLLAIPYFKDWLVGFVTAEGSFYEQNNKEFYFNVSQTRNKALMLAIHLLFYPSRNLYHNARTQNSIRRPCLL